MISASRPAPFLGRGRLHLDAACSSSSAKRCAAVAAGSGTRCASPGDRAALVDPERADRGDDRLGDVARRPMRTDGRAGEQRGVVRQTRPCATPAAAARSAVCVASDSQGRLGRIARGRRRVAPDRSAADRRHRRARSGSAVAPWVTVVSNRCCGPSRSSTVRQVSSFIVDAGVTCRRYAAGPDRPARHPESRPGPPCAGPASDSDTSLDSTGRSWSAASLRVGRLPRPAAPSRAATTSGRASPGAAVDGDDRARTERPADGRSASSELEPVPDETCACGEHDEQAPRPRTIRTAAAPASSRRRLRSDRDTASPRQGAQVGSREDTSRRKR